jgi:hypothetical protein
VHQTETRPKEPPPLYHCEGIKSNSWLPQEFTGVKTDRHMSVLEGMSVAAGSKCFGPFSAASGLFMGSDGVQSVLISQEHLSNTALALISSLPSHGRGRRFNPSPAYHVTSNDIRMMSLAAPS